MPHRQFETLTGIFADTAETHANAIAIEVPPGVDRPFRQVMSYAELDASALALAERLSPLVAHESIVAILLPRESPALYVAQLAALKAGGAFLCLDPRFPDTHVSSVLKDARPSVLVSDRAGLFRYRDVGQAFHGITCIEVEQPEMIPVRSAGGNVVNIGPNSLAYVIYTSGTTGEPKGVMVEHDAIANLIAGDREHFDLGAGDRVAQSSSPAYDSSIEEAWLAFGSGATLVLMDDDTIRGGPGLVDWLRDEKITVFCPPPTLLRATGCADPSTALPDLRLLYVGGEALTEELADRWSEGRMMVNGYGPTECAVTSVRARVLPGRPVTIGRPVPGVEAWVVDDSLAPVSDGETGELCLGGSCLARGYLGRPSLTTERFPTHPLFGRIYRTGDLVRTLSNGDLEYLGRIDAQVKLRGYRIELGAVESRIEAQAGVRAAACHVQGENAGRTLTAHVVPEIAGSPPDLDDVAETLRRELPDYMVPARWGVLDALPMTIGGKLDRSALPTMDAPTNRRALPLEAPRGALETGIAAAFAAALGIDSPISRRDDFFVDLGGDSLGAALVLLELGAQIDVSDNGAGEGVGELPTYRELYEARTPAGVASVLRERSSERSKRRFGSDRQDSSRDPDDTPRQSTTPSIAPWRVGASQASILVLSLMLGSAVAYGIFFALLPLVITWIGIEGMLLLVPLLSGLVPLLLAAPAVAVAALAKRLLIGRYEPGRYPVWSAFYVRHWLVTQAARTIPWGLLHGTLFAGMALRALGATVGRGVHIHRGVPLSEGGWDLLTLGDGVTLAQDASARTVELGDGHLNIGPVMIGDGATLDVRAGMSPHSTIGPGSLLAPLSWIPSDCEVPAGERWDGVPAKQTGDVEAPGTVEGRSIDPVPHGLLVLGLGAIVRAIWTLPFVMLGLFFVQYSGGADTLVLAWLDDPSPGQALPFVIAWPLIGLPSLLVMQLGFMRALARVRAGVYPIRSLSALRITWKTGTLAVAGRVLSGSLFWPIWLRAAGMRIGKRSEISTIIDVVPETLEIGNESFFADGIYLCAPHIHGGTVRVARSRLGEGTFLGNHAVVPAGPQYPAGLFAGVSTVVDEQRIMETGSTAWFGHPPFELPRRDVVSVDRRLTHEPGLWRYSVRLFFESLRFTLPILPLMIFTFWMWGVNGVRGGLGPAAFWVVGLPLITLASGAMLVLATALLKWSLLGRVQPGQHTFWSGWCARWDFVYMAWGAWARGPLAAFEGTPLLAPILRLFGMSIGRRAILGRGFAHVVDPDMIRIDDDATVDGMFQAHTFEDRVLKIDRLRIGAGATVGRNTVVFYGVDVGDEAGVEPHSVVMKRDRLITGGSYQGNPAQLQMER